MALGGSDVQNSASVGVKSITTIVDQHQTNTDANAAHTERRPIQNGNNINDNNDKNHTKSSKQVSFEQKIRQLL